MKVYKIFLFDELFALDLYQMLGQIELPFAQFMFAINNYCKNFNYGHVGQIMKTSKMTLLKEVIK